jgi:hypothetical protein
MQARRSLRLRRDLVGWMARRRVLDVGPWRTNPPSKETEEVERIVVNFDLSSTKPSYGFFDP